MYKSYATLQDLQKELSKHDQPPPSVLKPISNTGMTSINPQWRVEALTSVFGPYGLGWTTEVERPQWVEEMQSVYVRVRIQYKVMINGEEVEGTTGWHTGGTSYNIRQKEEAVKGTETDAFGKAASYLGIGGAIYRDEWDGDKYTSAGLQKAPAASPPKNKDPFEPRREPARQSPARQQETNDAVRNQVYDPENPGEYLVPMGRDTGRRIMDLSVKSNRGSLEFLIANNKNTDYRKALEAWLASADTAQQTGVPF